MKGTLMLPIVRVTKEDIHSGRCGVPDNCAVALAIERHTGRRAQVHRDHIAIGRRVFSVPTSVTRFVRAFDGRDPVTPFGFRLTETNRTVLRLQRLTIGR